MKKLLFVFPIAVLLAAGCNSSQQASNEPPVQTPVVQDANPTIAPVPTTTVSSTANWKTYSNAIYGFSFKYPQDYVVKEYNNLNNVSVFVSAKATMSLIDFNYKNTNQTLGENVKVDTDQLGIKEVMPVVINGLQAYEGLGLGIVSYYEVFFEENSKLVDILFKSGNQDTLQKSKAALTETQKQILSTFKFAK